ncbi:TPA: hypothetical protein WHD72_000886 [Neisseria meningitidis]|nr:hypothetical protein [Neisseria meningitidis]
MGVSPNAVKISNRNNEGIRINFTATVGKRVSQCYVTSVISTIGVTTSDAICLGGGTHKGKSQCNVCLKRQAVANPLFGKGRLKIFSDDLLFIEQIPQTADNPTDKLLQFRVDFLLFPRKANKSRKNIKNVKKLRTNSLISCNYM